MATFLIEGGRPLRGEIVPAGNKNAVLPMMAAGLLTDQKYVLENVPQITDVATMKDILTNLGATVQEEEGGKLKINAAGLAKFEVDSQLAQQLRASILLLGPLLARFGEVKLPFPGGDIIGKRAIDTHLQGFAQLGIEVKQEDSGYHLRAPKKINQTVFLDEASVTATENLLMFASAQAQETRINNAAGEPHVVNLIHILTKMGAKIVGAGSNQVFVQGKRDLGGAKEKIDPDHIEVGTFVMASAVTQGEVVIRQTEPEHLRMILLYLKRMGINFSFQNKNLIVRPSNLHAPKLGKIQTRPWPGFPSDLMSPFIVLATQAKGLTLCHDWMYSWRMFFVDKLIKSGAEITICDPHRILVSGPSSLRGMEAETPDIRAGISLVLAALCAQGKSSIHHVEHIDRGYPRIEKRLQNLGAVIKRVE
jgi:UDP-N-acetylglucosamine 1-carboxyvinyltransferase